MVQVARGRCGRYGYVAEVLQYNRGGRNGSGLFLHGNRCRLRRLVAYLAVPASGCCRHGDGATCSCWPRADVYVEGGGSVVRGNAGTRPTTASR